MNETEALACFDGLSNPDRLRMLRELVTAGPGGMPAGEIAERIGATPSRASFHLSALADTGLIRGTRQSRTILYAVDFSRIASLVSFLMEDCCRGNVSAEPGTGRICANNLGC